MKSFGLTSKGSVLIRKDDKAPFDVIFRAIDRAYVQRTLCVRHFASWLRPLPDGHYSGVEYAKVKIGDRLICTEYQGARWVVTAKDDELCEVILVHGIVAKDPACWELAIPQ